MTKKKKLVLSSTFSKLAITVLSIGTIATPFVAGANAAASTTSAPAAIDLQILETTDLHDNIMAYDYFKDKPDLTLGFSKTATLINKARQESDNNLLFDAGDLIQGNPMADYVAKIKKSSDTDVHPMIKAMNIEKYDVGTYGNHEFNYGLDYAHKVTGQANFPFVNANIYNATTGKNEFTPYVILDKTFKDKDGNDQHVKVGVIGFAPPQIMSWDKDNLTGKVTAKDIVQTAKEFIPKVKADGADIVVALVHSGCDIKTEGQDLAENAVYDLSKVPGINAIMFGHKHVNFPGAAEFNDKKGIDNVVGTINGVPAVEAGSWGNNLGVMKLTLLPDSNGKYTNVEAKGTTLRPIYDVKTKTSLAVEDPTIVEAVKADHEGTLAYVRGKIGVTDAPMYSYFARVQDDPTVQIVNNAQMWYVKDFIDKNLPEYKNVPVLSAAAPFKSGRQGGSDYTNIVKGDLSIKSANDLYLYPNTLKAVEVTGAIVKEWLEMSAGQFKQIDPASKSAQELVDNTFPGFNFDVIDGVTYQVDVTKPAKYNGNGDLQNPGSSRIVNLQYNGKPISLDQKFIVVTNNYRAGGGGNFPGVNGKEKIVIDSIEESRSILMEYINKLGTVSPTADKNWSIVHIPSNPLITFNSSPEAKAVLDASPNIKYLKEVTDADSIWGQYSISLDSTPLTSPVVGAIGDKDLVISGKSKVYAKVDVYNDDNLIVSGNSNSEGLFSLSIPKQKAGTILTVFATDLSGNKSEGTTVVVKDQTAPVKPTVAKIEPLSKVITGKTEANATVTVKAGSKVLVTGKANDKGLFTLPIKQQNLGTVLTITAKDKAGNVSGATTVVVKDTTPPVLAVVKDVLTTKTTVIKGTGEANTIVSVKVGSKVIATGKVSNNGKFSVKIPKQKHGVTVEIFLTDASNNVSKGLKKIVK
ncbi:bifunctional 2',3'-cyclic-nucleotide 2'-phosphodiesterase/3'-nucleotidase [Bacillus sp. RG28]|uniref:Bifunctional 2',3'-cyclic-nucleotide 2'-phosphodiesterase/3'-nucleotidase n=1 Tax=Gottfriedia endophytica TaxID=2820819 RepID=A0A940NQR7_9BACI|nr:bifunctional 2',3'-cyclic-nucleotide 2'-phosphodiesterase/3'-nucleotidase [Gottfriedia endophytica]MBP0726554.1 bifunctional 2',3'-cyclic-nucleotide 2'-phosphodiesterase/3'-nucleotidase [Gottfriedia endophytica]